FSSCGVSLCFYSFPTRRSSDLQSVSWCWGLLPAILTLICGRCEIWASLAKNILAKTRNERTNKIETNRIIFICPLIPGFGQYVLDRKSTRLNSSHQIISYAVFC